MTQRIERIFINNIHRTVTQEDKVDILIRKVNEIIDVINLHPNAELAARVVDAVKQFNIKLHTSDVLTK